MGLNTTKGLLELFNSEGGALNALLRQAVDQMRNEMVRSRLGEATSLKMLRSFLRLDHKTDVKKCEFIALDFGGSTIRAAMVRIGPTGKVEVEKQNDFKLPLEHQTGARDFLFNIMAIEIKKITANADPARTYPLVLTFAHPIRHVSLALATLESWAKEVDVPGVVGEDIAKILQEALIANDVKNVDVTAILSDIVATHAANPDASAALILGTGFNVSMLDEETREVLNVHPSAFDNLPGELLTQYDEDYLKKSRSRFSNLISGRKIADLIRLMSLDHIKNEKLRQRLLKEGSFPIELSSQLEGDMSAEEAKQVLAGNLGLETTELTQEDVEMVIEINKTITKRAGYMVAVSLSASLQMIDRNLDKDHVIVVDGSVYQKHPTLKKYIEEGLVKIVGQKRAGQIKFKFVKDAFILGAARAVNLVSLSS